MPHGKLSVVACRETMHEVSVCLDRFRAASPHRGIAPSLPHHLQIAPGMGYLWLHTLPTLCWQTSQTAFIPPLPSSPLPLSPLREWNMPIFLAQLDLKKAFDSMSHDRIASMLRRKNLTVQQIAVLCSWWALSSLEVRLAHVVTDRRISVARGVPEGAPESPLVFVVVADEILGGLRPQWKAADRAWTCDNVMLSCLGYADDISLFSNNKTSLETMVGRSLQPGRLSSGFGQNSL